MGNKTPRTAPRTATGKAKAKTPAKAARGDAAIAANPLNILLPYQRAVVEDKSRFLACYFSRQSGKSFTVAAREARRLMSVPKLTVVIAAPSERQSHESLEKVKDWLRAFGEAYADEEEFFSGDEIEKSFKAKAIKLPNESRCIAVPGRPDTVRGFSGDIWLDEFAFFEDPASTWKAIVPSILNPLRGGEKSFIITSTPNGKGARGKRFYEIMTGPASGKWTTHLDPKLLATFYTLMLQGQQSDREERKLRLAEERARKADEAEAVAKDSTLTPEQKAERLKAIFGLN